MNLISRAKAMKVGELTYRSIRTCKLSIKFPTDALPDAALIDSKPIRILVTPSPTMYSPVY